MKKSKRVSNSKRKYMSFRVGRIYPLHVTSSYNSSLRNYTLKLINNPKARNPTYAEVIAFLALDKTDEIPYTEMFKCPSYGAVVHNNAEALGIRCAYVHVSFQGEEFGHCCNAWATVDKGVVFTDSCGDPEIYTDNDKIVKIKAGEKYLAESLTNKQVSWSDYGVVEDISVIW